SMFRKRWIGEKKTSIEMQPEKDFEVNDGLVRLDYGLNRQFALDTTFGWTSAATESWNPRGKVQATRGLIDTQIGVRYRVLDENRAKQSYVPTLTLRVGGIIRGTYNPNFRMAPGDGASGFEIAVMVVKIFEPCGIGIYGDGGY